MRIGVLREIESHERRVALTPASVAKLIDEGHQLEVEVGAGLKAGFDDEQYRQLGATVGQRPDVIGSSGIVACVNGPGMRSTEPDWQGLSSGHCLIALHDPLWRPEPIKTLADTGATIVSLELIPRSTRAQSMDVLSSMATVVGYRAVLVAAARSSKLFPMLMTAGGTIPPAKVLVLGAGVAGLQAIATARRLGAVVQAYDIRPAAQEQIRSLGAQAVELDLDLDDTTTEDAGGYAAEQDDALAVRQQEQLAPIVAEADVVITTASIPGAESPELITTPMVEAMTPGSIIVDLAAERGGNCRLSEPGVETIHEGVIILGPTDLAARAADTSSLLFSNNLTELIRHLAPAGGALTLDFTDEITSGAVVGVGGEVRHPSVRERLGLAPLPEPEPPEPESLEAESLEPESADEEGAEPPDEAQTQPPGEEETEPGKGAQS